MEDLALGRVRHHLIAGRLAILELDPGEQVGEAVVLVLGPFLQRMIVTAGAGQRQAEERHARAFGQVDRVAMQHEEVGGAVGERAPLGRHDRAGEPVPGDVLRHALRARTDRTTTSTGTASFRDETSNRSDHL